LVVQGKTNKEIAADIYLSEGGVKNIITKLLDKLKVIDRTQLAVYAVENNLIKR
jgi:DNA-binding NarL/FixJ family response regulator